MYIYVSLMSHMYTPEESVIKYVGVLQDEAIKRLQDELEKVLLKSTYSCHVQVWHNGEIVKEFEVK